MYFFAIYDYNYHRFDLCIVGENDIGAHKMQNNCWYQNQVKRLRATSFYNPKVRKSNRKKSKFDIAIFLKRLIFGSW